MFSSLPKTFQDAIAITRMLNIQYIWIDSLCIFQDDLADWASESTCMKSIYGGATVCIAATAAPDGHAGLFCDRDVRNIRLLSVKLPLDENFEPCRALQSTYCERYTIRRSNMLPSKLLDMSPLN